MTTRFCLLAFILAAASFTLDIMKGAQGTSGLECLQNSSAVVHMTSPGKTFAGLSWTPAKWTVESGKIIGETTTVNGGTARAEGALSPDGKIEFNKIAVNLNNGHDVISWDAHHPENFNTTSPRLLGVNQQVLASHIAQTTEFFVAGAQDALSHACSGASLQATGQQVVAATQNDPSAVQRALNNRKAPIPGMPEGTVHNFIYPVPGLPATIQLLVPNAAAGKPDIKTYYVTSEGTFVIPQKSKDADHVADLARETQKFLADYATAKFRTPIVDASHAAPGAPVTVGVVYDPRDTKAAYTVQYGYWVTFVFDEGLFQHANIWKLDAPKRGVHITNIDPRTPMEVFAEFNANRDNVYDWIIKGQIPSPQGGSAMEATYHQHGREGEVRGAQTIAEATHGLPPVLHAPVSEAIRAYNIARKEAREAGLEDTRLYGIKRLDEIINGNEAQRTAAAAAGAGSFKADPQQPK